MLHETSVFACFLQEIKKVLCATTVHVRVNGRHRKHRMSGSIRDFSECLKILLDCVPDTAVHGSAINSTDFSCYFFSPISPNKQGQNVYIEELASLRKRLHETTQSIDAIKRKACNIEFFKYFSRVGGNNSYVENCLEFVDKSDPTYQHALQLWNSRCNAWKACKQKLLEPSFRTNIR